MPKKIRKKSENRNSMLYNLKQQEQQQLHCSNPKEDVTVFYVNDIGRMKLLREEYKEHASCKARENKENLMQIKEQQEKQISKTDILLDYSKDLLELRNQERQHTSAVLQETVNRCKSLSQQIGQPVRRSEELRLMEKSMETLIQELNK